MSQIMQVNFRTLAPDIGWNKSALINAFLHGPAPPFKDQLITLEIPDEINELSL